MKTPKQAMAIAGSPDSIKAKPCGCALAAHSLDRVAPPCSTWRWQGWRGGRCPHPFTSGVAQVLGLIFKELPTNSADEAEKAAILVMPHV